MIATLLLLLAQDSWEKSISGTIGGERIVITATSRLAGAIHSVKWAGKEFIDSTDHGRQLQSASNFDAGSQISNETFNPTEAGSRRDHVGNQSSSKLISITAKGNQLKTKSLMAFWLAPGEKSGENLAKNTTVLSQHLIEKSVIIGPPELRDSIRYDVTFTLPLQETHQRAVFEALTGYMPAEFSSFYTFEKNSGLLQTIDDGPGEQPKPVVLATPDGKFAMGVFSPQQPSQGYEGAGYGRFRFRAEKVVKWNCVFRVDSPKPGASFHFRHYVLVGSTDLIRKGLTELSRKVTSHAGIAPAIVSRRISHSHWSSWPSQQCKTSSSVTKQLLDSLGTHG